MMKRVLSLAALTLCFVLNVAPADATFNVALNKPVTLNGPFFQGGWGGGLVVDAGTVTNGVFFSSGIRWDQGPVWWDTRVVASPPYQSLTIDLQGAYVIEGLIIQADNNDSYDIFYWDDASASWQVAYLAPTACCGGAVTRPNPNDNTQQYLLPIPIVTRALSIAARTGDGWYSVAEIQAFGNPVAGPVALPGGPYWTGPGYAIALNGSASYHTEGPDKWLVSWEWELDGNGLFDDAVGEQAIFTRDQAGTYTVSLRVTDNTSVTDTRSATVVVEGPPVPTIGLPANGALSYFGDLVNFSGSTGAHIVGYEWTSDRDGLLSNLQSFSTRNLSVGQHVITYRVADSLGRSGQASRAITVRSLAARTDLALEWGDISFRTADGSSEVTNPGENVPLQIRAVIHNLSTEGTSSAGYVYFYDTWASGNRSQVYLGAILVGAIPPGGTATVQLPWTPNPADLQAGYHVIQVSAPHDPAETFFDNNTATHHIVLGDQQAAGNVAIDILNLNINDNYSTYVGSRVTCSGYTQYHWQNGYTMPMQGARVTFRLGDQTWEARTMSNGWFSQEIVLPLTPGAYTLQIDVTDATVSGSIARTVYANQYPGPDLIVNSIWLANGVAQVPETVYAYVFNRGGQTATGSFTSAIEVKSPSGEVVYNGTVSFLNSGGLGPGAGTYLAFAGWTPATAGNYQIMVSADVGNTVTETVENNNALTATLKVYPYGVDLEVVEITQSCDRVSARVVNHGGLNSGAGTLSFKDDLGVYATAALPSVPGKDGYGLWVASPLPYGGNLAGTRITVCSVSPEDSTPGNDCRAAVFDFTDKVDLTVSNLKVNEQSWWGTNTVYIATFNTLWAEVRNLGCDAAGGSLQFFVDSTAVGTPVVVPTVAGGATAVVSLPLDFAGYIAAKNYRLTGTVAAGAGATDAVPGNNTYAEGLIVSPQLPDYSVVAEDILFSFDPSRHPGRDEKFLITADVCNYGLADGTDYQVAFYEEGKTLIGVIQTMHSNPVVEPGDANCQTFTPVDAFGAQVTWGHGFSGNHVIMVTVSPIAGIQDDPNDANNSATRKVWVNQPPQAVIAVTSQVSTLRPQDTVSLSAAGSNDDLDLDGKGGVVRYDWEFDDGWTESTTSPSLSHRFNDGGNHTASVTVVDNNGEGTTASLTVVVPFLISASAGSHGIITPAGVVAVDPGLPYAFTFSPATGYHVADVLVDGVAQGPAASYAFTNLDADHTISASFAPDAFTITVTAGTGGLVSPPGAIVSYGDSQTFTIAAATGYHILDVKVDGVSRGPAGSVTVGPVTANATVEASFGIDTFTVTPSAGPGGSISPAAAQTVAYGGSQSFAITAGLCYRIKDVLVDGLSAGAVSGYSFSGVTADHAIDATFEGLVYTLTTAAGPGGAVTPGGTVACGDDRTVVITPNTGYQIQDVVADGVSLGPVASHTFSAIQADHSLSAFFTLKQFTITPSAGSGGSISPATAQSVSYGGSVAFTVTPATNYRIADVQVDNVSQGPVTSYTFANVTAGHTIDAVFSPYTAVTVVGPNGGEVIASGSTYAIRWGAPATAVKFNISYSTNNGSTFTTIVNGVSGYSYNWTVPKPNANSPQCRIRVQGLNSSNKSVGTDTSDAVFTIEVVRVTSPNGGEIWQRGTQRALTWATNATAKPVTKVTLSYSANGGTSWTKITDLPSNAGTYTWTVPTTINSTSCLFKAALFNNNSSVGVDISDANFTIQP